jgi:RNA polymerase sigma-70 factor (ECF subfamily)
VAAGKLELAEAEAALRPAPSAVEAPEVSGANVRELVDVYLDFVWRLVRRLGVPEADADDATQQVFWVAAQKLERITPGSERAYLGGTALRVAADFRRARQRRREELDVDVSMQTDPAPGPDELMDQRRTLARLDRVLESLPDKLRTTFVLYELEEMSMPEIAELLDVPVGTVASRLRLARDAFRSALRNGDEP